VAEASGDWIGFVDGDDEIEPDMYERLLHNGLEYNADISHCGYQMVFEDGRIHYFHNTGAVELHNKTKSLQELLSGQRIEPGLCNKLFRKTLFAGWEMDAGIKINEDLLMNYYLFSSSESAVFDDWCPYRYIVRRTSASRAKINVHKIYDPIRVKDLIRQAAPEEIASDAQLAYINTCMSVYHTLLLSGPEFRDDLTKVRDLLRHEKKSFSLLGKKRTMMANLIIFAPVVYKPIYGIYCRYFQKNVYS
jgi:glycosyltransferase involved in cell wall biosynthesis